MRGKRGLKTRAPHGRACGNQAAKHKPLALPGAWVRRSTPDAPAGDCGFLGISSISVDNFVGIIRIYGHAPAYPALPIGAC